MKRAFLIMPFESSLTWLRDEVIAAGVDEGVDVERGDDVFRSGVILDQIFKAIDGADLVIAVCTGKNANVFFELGYAWRRHDPILIAEGTNDLPFDIQHFRAVMYGGVGSAEHRATLGARLRRSIRAVLDEPRLPRGERLTSAPTPKQVARISGSLENSGRSHRLSLVNSGTLELHQVDVKAPEEAGSFHLLADGLPIDVLRPGERVQLLVSLSMGGGPRIFDVVASGLTEDGEAHSFPIKISI